MGKAKCDRCVYQAQPGADYLCNYFGITGHTRLAVPPEKCRHFREGERIERPRRRTELPERPAVKQRNAGRSHPRYDWERGKDLYERGLTDGEIAKELGCDTNTVHRWRRKLGLPANAGPRGKHVRQEASV